MRPQAAGGDTMKYYWEAYAEYADGTRIRRMFDYSETVREYEQQYRIECWLLGRHENCTFYTVNFIAE